MTIKTPYGLPSRCDVLTGLSTRVSGTLTYRTVAVLACQYEQQYDFALAAPLWHEAYVLARYAVNREWAQGRFLFCSHIYRLQRDKHEPHRQVPACCQSPK